MESKKSMPPILIVILTVIGTCLVGFLVYYGINYFKDEETPNNSVDDNPPNVVSPVGEEIDFPQKSDDSVALGNLSEYLSKEVFKTDFKNLEFTKNGNKLVISCEKYFDKIQSCGSIKVNINNEFDVIIGKEEQGSFSNAKDKDDLMYDPFDLLVKSYYFFKTSKYYVVYNAYEYSMRDDNNIKIYNNSNEVYNVSWVKSGYWLNENDWLNNSKILNVNPVIVNETLHYVHQTDTSAGNYGILVHYTIDLSKDVIQVTFVKEFAAYYTGEYQK